MLDIHRTILDLRHLMFWGMQEKLLFQLLLLFQLITGLHATQDPEAWPGASLDGDSQGTVWKVRPEVLDHTFSILAPPT